MKVFQMKVAVLFLIVFSSCMAWSQAQVTVPVKVVLATDSSTINFGYDKTATYCLDAALGEAEGPPTFGGVFDARFSDPRGFNDACTGVGTFSDFRTWLPTPTIDTFQLSFEGATGSTQWNVSWPAGLSSQFTSLTLKDAIFGIFTFDMLSVTSANLANNIRQWYIVSTPVVNSVRLDDIGRPGAFALNQNYPNPFNPSTTISFAIEKAVYADVAVYDVLGRKVRSLASEQLAPGYYSTVWNGVDDHGNAVGSGVYYVRMSARSESSSDQAVFSAVRKLLLMK